VIREMEPYGLELAEQPVSGRNLDEMAYVRSRIDTPLLANEASWTRFDQLEVIRRGAADVLSVDHQMDGGLLNLKRSAGICEAAGLPVLKHSLGELGVAQYAALHVMAATPNFLFANQGYGSFLEENVIGDGGPLPYRDGMLSVPDGPGIGVELNAGKVAEAAERYAREAAVFAFQDPAAMARTPSMPKL
jgi:L-alanine-DL-glutamate epimerase-like enolase superfamily enzyme